MRGEGAEKQGDLWNGLNRLKQKLLLRPSAKGCAASIESA
jgi:hypothetical protein